MNAPTRTPEAAALANIAAYANDAWDQRIVPALTDYVAAPAKSPMFDAQWAEHGLLDRVVCDAAAWVESRKVAGLTLEALRLEGRTPVIFFNIPATSGRRAAPSPDTPSRGADAESFFGGSKPTRCRRHRAALRPLRQ